MYRDMHQKSSTPKRRRSPLGRESADEFPNPSSPKRNRLQLPPPIHYGSWSRTSSRSSGGRSPSPQINNFASPEATTTASYAGSPQRTPEIPPIRPMLPQMTQQNSDFSTRSFASTAYLSEEEDICFGMVSVLTKYTSILLTPD